MTDIPDTIVCPDCGGTAHCISHLSSHERGQRAPDLDDADAFAASGEVVVAYRCSDCMDRWDVVWNADDHDDDGRGDDHSEGYTDGGTQGTST